MTESLLEEIRRYLRFGTPDENALRWLHSLACPKFESMADRFYERVSEHEDAVRVFQSSAQVERLKLSLQSWLERLLLGPWDEAYFEMRARIGKMHVKVGLPQRYMMSAMNHVRSMLFDVVAGSSLDARQARATERAIEKVLDLELAIMLETYREDSLAAVMRVERLEKEVLEERLSLTEARYLAILESADVIVIAANGQHQVLLFNRKAEDMTGYSRSEVASLSDLDTVFISDRGSRLADAIATASEGRTSSSFTTEFISRAGRQHWVRWLATSLDAKGHGDVCLIGVDQTEEHELGEEKRRAERLAALGTLAAGLAHEIRNPLNAAQLQSLVAEKRLMKLGHDAEDALLSNRTIRQELSRLAHLVEEFLDFARPRNLRLVAGDLRDSIVSVLDLLALDFAESGVSAFLSDSEPVIARFDDERIRQVVLNLVRNSMDALAGAGQIEIRVFRAKKSAVIEVVDDGDGPPPNLDLFQPFQTSKHEGTGLGLSIVHRICTDHGGTVSFRRDGGKTVFRVEIPVDGVAFQPVDVDTRRGNGD